LFLILRLCCRGGRSSSHHQQEDTAPAEEWGEFLHLPGEKFTDFSLIREEIQRETDRVVGTNKGISKESINLKIYSPHVLNLTVVDLPGVTRVPVGDQPEDIENQIKGMCLEFISNPNAVILAVSAANQDISNSDGLQLARLVDPEGLRTIGVLTKVDIMDQGTDAVDILLDRAGLQLRRGYVAIINRSQQDILNQVSVRQGLAKEEQFFSAHPKYRSILHKCGTKTMTTRLNQILMHHIRDCLPGIRSKIVHMVTEVKTSLDSFGESPDDLTPPKQGEYLLKTLSKFASNVTDFVDGKGSDVGVEMEELCGGARILYVFNEIFARRLMAVNPFDLLKDQDIQTAMANSNGVRHPLFIPESSFDLLVRKQITRLDTPGLQCVDLVYDEMIRMCLQVDASELSRFPTLRDRVFECIHKLLRECVKPTQTMISNLVKVELAFINTSHPDFIGGKKAILAQRNDNTATASGNGQQGAGGSSSSSEGGASQHHSSGSGQQHHHANGQGDKSSKGSDAGAGAGSAPTAVASVTATKVEQSEQSNPQEYQNPAAGGTGLPGFFNLFSKQSSSAPPSQSSGGHPLASPQRGGLSSSSRGSLDPFSYPSQNHGSGCSHPFAQSGAPTSSDSQTIRLRQVPEKMRSSEKPSGVEKVEIQVIKTLISSYFDIVKKSFTDMVPKVVMHFLVNSFKDGLQNELISSLYRESLFTDLLKETDDVAAKRQACREMRDLLLKAMEIVNEVRDYTVFDK
jgi:dynamin 1-like protein